MQSWCNANASRLPAGALCVSSIEAMRSEVQIDPCALLPQLPRQIERVLPDNVNAHSHLIAVHLKNHHSFTDLSCHTDSALASTLAVKYMRTA